MILSSDFSLNKINVFSAPEVENISNSRLQKYSKSDPLTFCEDFDAEKRQ